MVHHFIWNVQIVCVLDEGPAGFATAGVTPESDIGLKVRNDAGRAVEGLLRDRLEEEIEGFDETLLYARCCRNDETFPVAGRSFENEISGWENEKTRTLWSFSQLAL
jgi:hypothetical protein